MTKAIDYYFICSSPYAYLGHKAFRDLAARHGATIRYRPIDIGGVWANSGSVPLRERPPLRQRYRRIELQRFAEWRDLPLNLNPKYFPVDSALADKIAIALVEKGKDPAAFVWRAHCGVWANEEDIADAVQLAIYLEAEGHDAQPLIEFAQGARAEEIRQENTREAAEGDAVGAPVYVYRGEPFWGQDRLDLLERMLQTKREPFAS